MLICFKKIYFLRLLTGICLLNFEKTSLFQINISIPAAVFPMGLYFTEVDNSSKQKGLLFSIFTSSVDSSRS